MLVSRFQRCAADKIQLRIHFVLEFNIGDQEEIYLFTTNGHSHFTTSVQEFPAKIRIDTKNGIYL